MTKLSDLPGDLVGEVLSRVPSTSLSSVRSTCKNWRALCESRARKQFLGFMLMEDKVCSLSFDLQGLHNDNDFLDPATKCKTVLHLPDVRRAFHCDGLLLCFSDRKNLVVWNPYIEETRWIQPRTGYDYGNMFALGYDDKHNHKILRVLDGYLHKGSEIYEFSSNSWRGLDVSFDCDIYSYGKNMSLKGKTYFLAQETITEGFGPFFLLCFDFTTERFGPPLFLPFQSSIYDFENVSLSCVKDEHLAVLHQLYNPNPVKSIDIWITTAIEPNALSWSRVLKVDMTLLNGFLDDVFYAGSFFVDEEKKVVVVFDVDGYKPTKACSYQTAYIFGQDGYFKSVIIGEARKPGYRNCDAVVCSGYVPSLEKLLVKGKKEIIS